MINLNPEDWEENNKKENNKHLDIESFFKKIDEAFPSQEKEGNNFKMLWTKSLEDFIKPAYPAELSLSLFDAKKTAQFDLRFRGIDAYDLYEQVSRKLPIDASEVIAYYEKHGTELFSPAEIALFALNMVSGYKKDGNDVYGIIYEPGENGEISTLTVKREFLETIGPNGLKVAKSLNSTDSNENTK